MQHVILPHLMIVEGILKMMQDFVVRKLTRCIFLFSLFILCPNLYLDMGFQSQLFSHGSIWKLLAFVWKLSFKFMSVSCLF